MSARGKRDIAAALDTSPRLLSYVRRNFEDLAATVGSERYHDWSVLASIAKARQLTDAYGRPPSIATIARTWATVARERRSTDAYRSTLHFPDPTHRTRAPPLAIEPQRQRCRDPDAVHSTSVNNIANDDAFTKAEERRKRRPYNSE